MKKIPNTIQLITYPDSLGSNLKDLRLVLEKYFPGDVFGGVHILPFFPSSGDRGFSPVTQFEVNHEFGSWDDIRAIGQKYILMSDLVVNHISRDSIYFQDYLENGDQSQYRDFFITAEKFSRHIPRHYHDDGKSGSDNAIAHIPFDIFGSKLRDILERYPIRFSEHIINFLRRKDPLFHLGGVNKFVLRRIYRPRPMSPFIPFRFVDGRVRNVWCTFTDNQIDLDVANPGVKGIFREVLRRFAENNINIVRLDAIGYAVKKRGTSNFLIPQTYEFTSWIAAEAHRLGMAVLPEVHFHHTAQKKLSETRGVDLVYDFALPMLVLQAIFSGDNKNMVNWLSIRPNNAITTLDTHDGLPVPDVQDLMTVEEKDATVETVLKNGGNSTMRASGLNTENVDIYQVNCTYYSALNENDVAYLMARAIQFFVPGIPQVYYVGLLAGENDMETLTRTNIGRDINRHTYTIPEIEANLERPVVKRLMELMRLRNTHPAFSGEFRIEPSPSDKLVLSWKNGKHLIILEAFLKSSEKTLIHYSDIEDASLSHQIILGEWLVQDN